MELRSVSSRRSEFDVDEYEVRDRPALITRLPPPKTTIAVRPSLQSIIPAVVFLSIGSIFLIAGISVMWTHIFGQSKDSGIALLVLGGLMFIPGSYASTVIYGTYHGWEGYDYSQLPSYDD